MVVAGEGVDLEDESREEGDGEGFEAEGLGEDEQAEDGKR